MDGYKKAINICCNPECPTGYNMLNTHHIVPISNMGRCKYINYIVLCFDCHRRLHFHSEWEKNIDKLIIWKINAEMLILGASSADYSQNAFGLILRRRKKRLIGAVEKDDLLAMYYRTEFYAGREVNIKENTKRPLRRLRPGMSFVAHVSALGRNVQPRAACAVLDG